MDTLRVGRVLRALRHRLGWRQVDVARAAGLTQDDVSRAERGRMRDVGKLGRHGAALDADVQITIRWRGGEVDRLLDAVCRLLVLPGLTTPRRQLARHSAVLERAYRSRGDTARRWLRSPAGSASLLLFAPHTRGARGRRDGVSRRRIRRERTRVRIVRRGTTYAREA